MHTILGKTSVGLLILSVTGVACAGFTAIPEPGILELAAIGGIAAIVAKFARRRK